MNGRVKKQESRPGSLLNRMAKLDVGEALYVERFTVDQCRVAQRQAATTTRYTADLQGKQFTTDTCLAVFDPFTTRYLVRIERTV